MVVRIRSQLGLLGATASIFRPPVQPEDLVSRYTYSTAPDGSPFWEKETAWPDPMCLISAVAAVTTNLTFTTGIYIAPVRDLITVAKTVGTTAVLSHNRVRLGRRRRMVRGGVRPDRAGLPHPGQAAQRHDPGVAGHVGRGVGRVPRALLRRPRSAR